MHHYIGTNFLISVNIEVTGKTASIIHSFLFGGLFFWGGGSRRIIDSQRDNPISLTENRNSAKE